MKNLLCFLLFLMLCPKVFADSQTITLDGNSAHYVDGNGALTSPAGGGSGVVTSSSQFQVPYFSADGTSVIGTSALSTNATNVGVGTIAPITLFDVNRKLNVLSGGNVGIGSINPNVALDVAGSIRITTNLGIGTTSPGAVFSVGNGNFTMTAGGTTTLNSANTSTVPITLTANTLTSANGVAVSSSNTAFTAAGLGSFILSGSSTNLTGSALFASVTGASSSLARVVQFADSTATDTTPFSIDSNNGNVGIGTFVPMAQLDIRFQTPTAPFQIGSSATDATGAWVRVDGSGNVGIATIAPSAPLSVTGHIHSHGSAPTVASNDCGTTSQGTVAAKSTDVAGSFTVGTLAVTSCAVTFNGTWLNAPQCIVIDDSNVLAVKAVSTTTKLTVSAATSMSGDVISYICVGNE